MFKCILEGQRVIMVTEDVVRLLPNVILKIPDILAVFMPAFVSGLRLFLRVDRHQHPIVKQRIGLRVIDNVELHCLLSLCIHYSEVEPLGVALSIDIILHDQVVFIFAQFLC
jgi:hypothetical protein